MKSSNQKKSFFFFLWFCSQQLFFVFIFVGIESDKPAGNWQRQSLKCQVMSDVSHGWYTTDLNCFACIKKGVYFPWLQVVFHLRQSFLNDDCDITSSSIVKRNHFVDIESGYRKTLLNPWSFSLTGFLRQKLNKTIHKRHRRGKRFFTF